MQTGFTTLPRARRKKQQEHEREAVSTDYVPEDELADGDITYVPTSRELPAAGERRMLASLLQLAIDDAKRGDRDAVRWLLDDTDVGAHGTFTVTQCCAHLGVDIDALRGRLHGILRRVEQRQDAAPPDVGSEGALAA